MPLNFVPPGGRCFKATSSSARTTSCQTSAVCIFEGWTPADSWWKWELLACWRMGKRRYFSPAFVGKWQAMFQLCVPINNKGKFFVSGPWPYFWLFGFAICSGFRVLKLVSKSLLWQTGDLNPEPKPLHHTGNLLRRGIPSSWEKRRNVPWGGLAPCTFSCFSAKVGQGCLSVCPSFAHTYRKKVGMGKEGIGQPWKGHKRSLVDNFLVR